MARDTWSGRLMAQPPGYPEKIVLSGPRLVEFVQELLNDLAFSIHEGDVRANAWTDYLAEHGHEFDLIVAGPMCRDHTPLTSVAGFTGTGWQLAKAQAMLIESGKPYVLENVPASPLKADIVLCGKMFGLRVKRHRKFKSNLPLVAPPHPDLCRTIPTATKKRRERWDQGWDLSVTGDIGTYYGPEGMGIDWMSGNELSQAIPPAYTEYIGRQLMVRLGAS